MTDQNSPDIAAILKGQITKALGDQYGQATVDIVALILPPLKRVGLSDLSALAQAVANRDTDAALAASFAAMTNEELVAAKQALAGLLAARAGDNAALASAINAAIMKAITLALGFALVGL